MTREYPLNTSFFLKWNGVQTRIVVRKHEGFFDRTWNETFRKSCEGCCFSKAVWHSCCGHRYVEYECRFTDPSKRFCSPSTRSDGNFVDYKLVRAPKS